MKIHVQELGDRPRAFDFDVPPSTFDAYVKEVDELYHAADAPLHVRLVAERMDDMVLLSGEVSGDAGFECARCLAEVDLPIQLDLRWTFVPRKKLVTPEMSSEEEFELTADDLDVSFFDGDEIDLAEVVREAIILHLDPIPRCEVDGCEERVYETASANEASAPDDAVDPRWAPLAALKESIKN